jgi:signal transduction histidine kinase
MPRSLYRLRLLIPVLICSVTALLIIFLTFERTREGQRALALSINETARSQMDQLQDILSDCLVKGDLEQAKQRLSYAALSPQIVTLILTDADHKVLIANRQEWVNLDAAKVSHYDKGLAKKARSLQQATLIASDHQHIHGYFPVTLGIRAGEIRPLQSGTLYAEYDLTDRLNLLRHEAYKSAAKQGAVLVIFALVLSFSLHILITKPVDRLVWTVNEFAKGNLDVRSRVSGMNEIDQLALAFDDMAEELARSQEDLHVHNVMLEQEVAERQMAQESLQEQTILLKKEIEQRRKAQDDIERLNAGLERHVQERTAELSEKNLELQRAYEDLKRMQAQLLQQDKMASVGLLAAGVAHEINNPMGFIISNLSSLGKYVEKVTAYLDASEKALAGSAPAIRQMAAQERQKYKIDRIRKDLPDLISETSDGAQRIRQIVQDMKRFSRSDSMEGTYSDINEGVESTLSIAWNELKYKASIIKEYGQLPRVWCNPGQLNQVFLNILVNAAHAIEDRGVIRITTWEEDVSVRIAISDTGSGIPPEHVKQIFDPFFTTKEAGKGTGLGLAIAYDIVVNKHGGRIDVTSELGKGSTFTITLPVRREGASRTTESDPSPV